eukprot:TRINITY_DN3398_c0_g2_i1.p1 TRINITY_DN3398_c0_g2~~TRINITY_DN3398_c0_g2_i1.p1  ORF type:complete len:982 (+),score=204.45 TRINITY_DN3398_c0_g2_i1:87-3032(+)
MPPSASVTTRTGALSGANPIKVVCRVRAQAGQRARSERIHLDTASGTVRLDSSEVRSRLGRAAGVSEGSPISQYELDGVFDPQASQFDLYRTVGIPAVSALLKGGERTVSIVSCGAEATGKSYTLMGPCEGSRLSLREDNRGLVLRMVDSIFNRLRQSGTADSISVEVSHILITAEDSIVDLLHNFGSDLPRDCLEGVEGRVCATADDPPPSLQWQTVFGGCTAVRVSVKEDAVAVLDLGLRRAGAQKGDRATALRIVWGPRGEEQCSHLIVVDCAPVYTKSMHNLRDVVGYLANDTSGRATVPYGKSKLTRLLRGDLCLSSSNATRLIVHIKLSDLDLDVFDSSSILQFASTARKVPRVHCSQQLTSMPSRPAPTAAAVSSRSVSVPAALSDVTPPSSRRSTPRLNSPPPQLWPAPAGSVASGGSAALASPASVGSAGSVRVRPPTRLKSDASDRSSTFSGAPSSHGTPPPARSPLPSSRPQSRIGDASPTASESPTPRSVGSGQQSSQMLASYLQSLTAQLREKEEQHRQAMGEVERVTGLLHRERERAVGLKAVSSEQDTRLRELEMLTRSRADHFVCHRCNTNPYLARFLSQSASDEEGDGEGPLATPAGQPVGLLIPLPRERSPDAPSRSPTPGRAGSPSLDQLRAGSRSPLHSRRGASPAHGAPAAVDLSDSSGSDSEADAPSMASGEHDLHSLSSGGDDSMCSDERASERRIAAQVSMPAATQILLRKLEGYKERCKRTKARLRKALKAHAYERERVQETVAQLEDSERQKQELISKCITATSRLDENKNWMRKVKRSLQTEKAQGLPRINEQWRQQIAALRQATASQSRDDRESAQLRETVQSLKTMVAHLSAEYNRRVGEMLGRARDGRAIVEDDDDSRGRVSADELRQENDALRGNVAALMKVMEHCYAENSHLSSLSNRLSSRLGEANDRILTLESHGRALVGSPVGSPMRTPSRRGRAQVYAGELAELE